MLYILDYGAGNVASLANSVRTLGYEFKWVESVEDIEKAGKILFPGVGSFDSALHSLRQKGFSEPLKKFIASGRPYMGICIGMQALFESSDESPSEKGLGVVPGNVGKFSVEDKKAREVKKTVPCIGWNGATVVRSDEGGKERMGFDKEESYYFVHSFRVAYDEATLGEWALTLTQYGEEVYVSSIQKDNVFATQCHPEKSGKAGLEVLKAWLELPEGPISKSSSSSSSEGKRRSEGEIKEELEKNGFKKRIVACLDVRANDDGDLVVTKGDQYDVRESDPIVQTATSSSLTTQPTSSTSNDSSVPPSLDPPSSTPSKRQVRNLGKPVALAQKYYSSGADEICFLNITSFRSCPLHDQPMLDVVRKSCETIFVPITIGGGIRDTVDPDGTKRSALEVAGTYFRNGADKISIGGDAVDAVLSLLKDGKKGTSGIETISKAYGAQAVVVSIDPKRSYATSLSSIPEIHRPSAVDLAGPLKSGEKIKDDLGPNGERYCWYQCTVKGGRELADLDVVQLAQGVESLGAGELLLNSVDRDGQKNGFDLRLVELVKTSVGIPVVASSGAGRVEDFEEVFRETGTEAALAAGIFHREEVGIMEVKEYLKGVGTGVRK